MAILTVRELSAEISGKQVIDRLNFFVDENKVVVLQGANGSGKSSFTSVLMGNPQYKVVSGEVSFAGINLLATEIDERAKAGLYIAWQQPMTIPGVSVFTLCKTAYEARGNRIDSVVAFKERLEMLLLKVGLTKDYLGRSINEGFSGGEKKRLELLQLILLKPKLVILDEIDSGLDIKGRKLMAEIINEMSQKGTAFVVISHYQDLLTAINADQVWEMTNGRIQPRI